MTYLVIALPAEARAFLDYLPFRRSDTLPFPLYYHDDFLLCVTGSGYENAVMATAALLGHRPPKAGDLLLNTGICAAPEAYPLGTLLVAHKVTCKEMPGYYPDMLLSHDYPEVTLESVLNPQREPLAHPVDMEAHAVFKAASRFMGVHQLLFAKIVSDHFEPDRITKEMGTALITAHVEALLQLCRAQQHLISPPLLFDAAEQQQIEQLKSHFTQSQQHRLEDALCYYRLKGEKPLPEIVFEPIHFKSKKEKGSRFDALVTALTH